MGASLMGAWIEVHSLPAHRVKDLLVAAWGAWFEFSACLLKKGGACREADVNILCKGKPLC